MDIATIIGIIGGVGLLLWAILGKSDLDAFIDTGSIAIVVGGAVSAALISFPIKNLLGVAKVVKNCFFAKSRDPMELISDMVKYAEIARRDGILALLNNLGTWLIRGLFTTCDDLSQLLWIETLEDLNFFQEFDVDHVCLL